MAFFRKAAATGSSGAEREIGRLYARGWGVARDYHAAMACYRRAAAEGNAHANLFLDRFESRYRRAVAGGNAQAMASIGRLYQLGKGVGKDAKEAAVWYARSIVTGDAQAIEVLGGLCKNKGPHPEPFQTALGLVRRAANSGNSNAIFGMSEFYWHGWMVHKNPRLGAALMRRAANAGSTWAMLALGWSRGPGGGSSVDLKSAFAWLHKAAVAGNPLAMSAVGDYLGEGMGMGGRMDNKRAVYWFRKSATRGCAMGMINLGSSYATGTGVPFSPAKAIVWYKKAAAASSAVAKGARAEIRHLRVIERDARRLAHTTGKRGEKN